MPTISDVETTEAFTDADTGVTITGTNFLASQGTGKVELASTSTYTSATKVNQTVTSWGATSIDFTAGLGGLTPGTLYLFVSNSGGSRNAGQAVTVSAQAAGASWREALNTPTTVNTSGGNVQLRLRIAMLNSGAAAGATAYKWQYRKNGGTWTDITASSTNVKTFATSFYADGADVPQLLTADPYQSDNNAAEESTGTFTLTAGLAAATGIETEIALEVIAADVANTDTLDFRIVQSDNTVFTTYTQTPQIVISAAGGGTALLRHMMHHSLYTGGV